MKQIRIVGSTALQRIIFRCILTSHYTLWTHTSMPYYTDDIIGYPLLADADTGIWPHAAPRYHARPKAKRGIAVLSVDKFPYPRQQTGGNEFIPCSNVWNLFKVLKSCFELKPISIAQRNIYVEQPATDWYCDVTRWHTAIVTSDMMSCTSTWHDDAFIRFTPGVETHRKTTQSINI